MPAVGPELPAHLQTKRKRAESAETTPDTPPKRRRNSSGSEENTAPRRVIGPSLPPAPLSELPPSPPEPNADGSDSDDDFGPSLPPTQSSATQATSSQAQDLTSETSTAEEPSQKPQREEWMLVPPKQGDWTTRIDPTKLKNRKFNTGKGSKAATQKNGADDNALWTETPEQKRQRLEDEVMGVKKPAQLEPEKKRDPRKEEEARETEKRIREYNEKTRGGTSLYEEHKKAKPDAKEDDPSARAFDREKDIGLGVRIGHAQKREMLNRAKDFGSRFAGGSYL